jgi:acyl-CoA thioester hydrolase
MAAPEYTYETTVPVRFRDLDVLGQVHNAVVLVYAEEARVRYFRDVLDVRIEETDGAIVHQSVDYAAQIDAGDELTVSYRVARIGTSSLEMAFAVETDAVAATGEVVHVVLDEAGDPRPIPSSWREQILAFEAGPVEQE